MSRISYINHSDFCSGNTTKSYMYTFSNDDDNIIRDGQTVILMIATTSSIMTPDQTDWNLITNIGNSSGNLYSFYCQFSATTSSNPNWTFDVDNEHFTNGMSIVFSGCTRNESKLINGYNSRSNVGSDVGTSGFTTTMSNTALLQMVAGVSGSSMTILDWKSTPSLTWDHVYSGSTVSGSTTIFMGSGVSLNAPKNNYTDITYDKLPSSYSNLAIDIALYPNMKTNELLNLVQGFYVKYS